MCHVHAGVVVSVLERFWVVDVPGMLVQGMAVYFYIGFIQKLPYHWTQKTFSFHLNVFGPMVLKIYLDHIAPSPLF